MKILEILPLISRYFPQLALGITIVVILLGQHGFGQQLQGFADSAVIPHIKGLESRITKQIERYNREQRRQILTLQLTSAQRWERLIRDSYANQTDPVKQELLRAWLTQLGAEVDHLRKAIDALPYQTSHR